MCDNIPINRHKLNTLDYNGKVTKNPQYLFDKKGFSCVAGVGFEPTTSGYEPSGTSIK